MTLEPPTAGTPPSPPLACPRCGYDQRGGYATLASQDRPSWPLRAVCPECGVEFWWGDLLNPELRRLEGFVEHARGWRQWCRWSVRTWLWCWWPPIFWNRVRLEHRPRNWRALMWWLIPMVTLQAAGAMALAWMRMSEVATFGVAPSFRRYAEWLLWAATHPIGGWRVSLGDPWYTRPRQWHWSSNLHFFPWWGFPLMTAGAVFVALLLFVRATRREMRVTSGHVIRAFIYWLSMVLLMWVVWAVPAVVVAGVHIVAGDRAAGAVQKAANLMDANWSRAVLIFGPWTVWWFWCALSIGWRVSRPGRVAAVLLVPSFLAAAAALLALNASLGVRSPW